jgi:hypothetical protein
VGATITFDDGARLATQATDEEGRFRLSRLQQGDQEFAITAPGYLPLTLKVTLPHQGQLLDSQINLLPLKAEVLRLYQVLSAQFAPNLEVLPRWTPRELVAQARVNARAEAQDLRDFINLFEEVYYGPHAPSAEQLQRAESLVARLVPGTEDVDSTNSGHKRG